MLRDGGHHAGEAGSQVRMLGWVQGCGVQVTVAVRVRSACHWEAMQPGLCSCLLAAHNERQARRKVASTAVADMNSDCV